MAAATTCARRSSALNRVPAAGRRGVAVLMSPSLLIDRSQDVKLGARGPSGGGSGQFGAEVVGEGAQAGSGHPAGGGHAPGPLAVDVGPVAPAPARRPAHQVAGGVAAADQAVDPAVADRLVEDLVVLGGAPLGALAIDHQPDLAAVAMVLHKPVVPGRDRLDTQCLTDLHGITPSPRFRGWRGASVAVPRAVRSAPWTAVHSAGGGT